MVWSIAVIVLIIVVGSSVLAYHYRSEKGIESGITSFRRELRALAPESKDGPRRARPTAEPPRSSGVGILRSKPDASGPREGEVVPEAREYGARSDADTESDAGPGVDPEAGDPRPDGTD